MATNEQQQPTTTMTIDETARQLRISRATLYKLMASGELPYSYVGRSRRVSRAALDEYLVEHTDNVAHKLT